MVPIAHAYVVAAHTLGRERRGKSIRLFAAPQVFLGYVVGACVCNRYQAPPLEGPGYEARLVPRPQYVSWVATLITCMD
jgi:hypothetical protein